MTRETLEELRERLLRQHNVQQMIQVRAYEIYQMRGGRPGGEAQDWFHAESEVLAFLIARESAEADERAQAEAPPAEPALESRPPKKPRARAASKPTTSKPAATTTTAKKRATPKKSGSSKAKPKRLADHSKSEESGT